MWFIRLDALVTASGRRRTDGVSASLTSPGHVVSDGEAVCVIGSAIGGVSKSKSILPLITLSLV